MKRRNVVLIMIAVIALLTVAAVSVSAQDIDVENMDNAELTALLQAILQKLEADEASKPVSEESVEEPSAILTEGPVPAVFEIYINKKIIAEKLPDSMFVRKPTGGDNKSKPSPDEKDGGDYIYDGLYFDGRYIPEDQGISYSDGYQDGTEGFYDDGEGIQYYEPDFIDPGDSNYYQK